MNRDHRGLQSFIGSRPIGRTNKIGQSIIEKKPRTESYAPKFMFMVVVMDSAAPQRPTIAS